ncbi:MAG: hypothetical protein NTY46_02900 [Candidatus Sumerlaeota bacterium]|nr:hypothetical protein [Candidatus Sumerlaeota bacterium]
MSEPYNDVFVVFPRLAASGAALPVLPTEGNGVPAVISRFCTDNSITGMTRQYFDLARTCVEHYLPAERLIIASMIEDGIISEETEGSHAILVTTPTNDPISLPNLFAALGYTTVSALAIDFARTCLEAHVWPGSSLDVAGLCANLVLCPPVDVAEKNPLTMKEFATLFNAADASVKSQLYAYASEFFPAKSGHRKYDAAQVACLAASLMTLPILCIAPLWIQMAYQFYIIRISES